MLCSKLGWNEVFRDFLQPLPPGKARTARRLGYDQVVLSSGVMCCLDTESVVRRPTRRIIVLWSYQFIYFMYGLINDYVSTQFM
jgi:hypothetical protein